MSKLQCDAPLPKGWVWTTLGEIGDTTRKRVNPQAYPDLPFVGMEHVEAHTRRVLATVPAGEMRSAAEYFEPGDVLYGRLRPYLNKVFCPDFTGLCSGEFIPFRKSPHLESKYLLYFLNSWDFVSFASHLNEGDRPRVDFNQLAGYHFPLPPLAEQQRIVEALESYFTRLDAAVAALKRVQANLRRYRASVLKAACEGRLVPTEAELARAEGRAYEPASALLERILAERRAKWEEENPGKKYKEPARPDVTALPELPEGWTWASPEQISSFEPHSLAIGPFGSNLKVSDYTDSGVPLVFVRNIRTNSFADSDSRFISPSKAAELAAHKVRGGDILITKMGDPPGDACLYPFDRPDGIITADCIKLTLSELLTEREFFVSAINSKLVHNQILGITRGVAQLKVSLERFRSIAIPLPPSREQQRINLEIKRQFSIVEKISNTVTASLIRAERLRQSILQRAFSGQLVPQDPNDEPAAALLERIRAVRQGQRERVR